MDGIVSCLDAHHEALFADLWRELEHDFGVSWVARRIPIPHFSYHVAEGYDQAGIEAILRRMAPLQRPFKVRTTGLGMFTGQAPVLYMPVVRTAELSQIHSTLWPYLSESASGIMNYYHPTNWMPHITLAQGDLTAESLSAIFSRWMSRSFDWEITIDNICLICDVGKPAMECNIRVEFGGS